MEVVRRLLPLCLVVTACSVSNGEDTNPGNQELGGAPTEPSVPAAPAAPTSTPAPAAPATPAAPTPDRGAVFTISNDPVNAVVAFERNEDGTLGPAVSTPTGGMGTGAGLGSQAALALSADGKVLVAVDPGSNELAAFAVNGAKLTRTAHVLTTGKMPVSVAMHGDLVYVLNAGETACISGFRLGKDGSLTFIEGSKHTLSAPAAGGAQIAFSPNGDALVVTEKAANVIDTFTVDAQGRASDGEALPSSGMTPFGFAFTKDGTLVVSEAFGAMPGAGAVSTYRLGAPHANAAGGFERDLVTVTASLKTSQTAPCWVTVGNDGKIAFSSNTPSGTISSFVVAADGALSLIGDGANGVTGPETRPTDIALDRLNKRLYVLDSGTDDLAIFDVGPNGALAKRNVVIALPPTAQGLVAK